VGAYPARVVLTVCPARVLVTTYGARGVVGLTRPSGGGAHPPEWWWGSHVSGVVGLTRPGRGARLRECVWAVDVSRPNRGIE